MNAKKAKKLRKMARSMVDETAQREKKPIVPRALLVDPRHEIRTKTHGIHRVTAINDPYSDRGVTRWLKKEMRNGT